MHAEREQESIPLWTSDQLDSRLPPQVEPVYFDTALNSWVLSRFDDVLAAFRSSMLNVDSHEPRTSEDERALTRMRTETREALTPAQLSAWSEAITPAIGRQVGDLAEGHAIDLLDVYLRPVCLAFAALVTFHRPTRCGAAARAFPSYLRGCRRTVRC